MFQLQEKGVTKFLRVLRSMAGSRGMRRNLGRVRLPRRRVLLLGRLEPLLPTLPHALYLLCMRTIGPAPSVLDFPAAAGSEGSHPLASLTPAQVQVLFNLVNE